MAKNLVNGTNIVIEENADNINMNLSSTYTSGLTQQINNSFKNNNIYSTSETVVGVWIDGKQIYRKVYNFTTGSSNNYTIFTDNNIDTMTDAYGWISYGSGYHKIGGYANSSYYSLLQFNTSEHKLYIYFNGYANKSGFVTVEYTKTTD